MIEKTGDQENTQELTDRRLPQKAAGEISYENTEF